MRLLQVASVLERAGRKSSHSYARAWKKEARANDRMAGRPRSQRPAESLVQYNHSQIRAAGRSLCTEFLVLETFFASPTGIADDDHEEDDEQQEQDQAESDDSELQRQKRYMLRALDLPPTIDRRRPSRPRNKAEPEEEDMALDISTTPASVVDDEEASVSFHLPEQPEEEMELWEPSTNDTTNHTDDEEGDNLEEAEEDSDDDRLYRDGRKCYSPLPRMVYQFPRYPLFSSPRSSPPPLAYSRNQRSSWCGYSGGDYDDDIMS